MNLESRKINLINWISSLQEESILYKVEQIQKDKTDWWDTINDEDKKAINEGVEQLDSGDFLTRSEMRSRIKKKYNL